MFTFIAASIKRQQHCNNIVTPTVVTHVMCVKLLMQCGKQSVVAFGAIDLLHASDSLQCLITHRSVAILNILQQTDPRTEMRMAQNNLVLISILNMLIVLFLGQFSGFQSLYFEAISSNLSSKLQANIADYI